MPSEVQWVVNVYRCPFPRCCCSAARSATISGGGGWLVIGTSCLAIASLVCALAPSLPILLAGARCRGSARPAACPTASPCSTPRMKARSARPRSRHLGGSRRSHGRRNRATDRRLAGGHGRLAEHLLHQPAVRRRRDPLALTLRRGGREAGEGADSTVGGAAAGDARPRRRRLMALTLWSADVHLHAAAPCPLGRRHRPCSLRSCDRAPQRRRAMMPLALFAESRCFSALNLLTFLLYGAFAASVAADPLRADRAWGIIRRSRRACRSCRCRSCMRLGSPTMGKPRRAARAAHSADCGAPHRWPLD